MTTRDPRIDDYIAKAATFAQPILQHLREVVHATCPGTVESIKWGRPHFEHGGHILAGMAAFQQHASFLLWRRGEKAPIRDGEEGMGQFGKLTSVEDLPDDALLAGQIRAAIEIIDRGPGPKPKAAPRPDLPIPDELAAALDHAPAARATFDGFAPSHRREYCEWVGEAKRAETRATRVVQAIEWLSEGKSRNWKYHR